jgi:predicted transglutaminase-like cysteine proteinase
MRNRVLAAGLIAMACGLGGCQSSGGIAAMDTDPPHASSMTGNFGAAPDPGGFLAFCLRMPGECAQTSDSGVVAMTPQAWASIQRVNRELNRAIRPQTDLAHYDREEYWTIPADGLGDCEDYALAKRQKLIAAGLPAGALRVAIVMTRRGTLHAVLTVTTSDGDYMLDNLSDAVIAWTDSPYRWIERQDSAEPWRWVALLSADERRSFAALDERILTGALD